jgi:hypothetical protein
MSNRQIITRRIPGRTEPDPHEHDGSEISGDATFLTVRADRILAGTISGQAIVVAGAEGSIQSDDYEAGLAGWAIVGDGSAEFSDVTVRGVVVAGAGSSIGFDDVTAATNEAALVVGGSWTVRSADYSAGAAGWSIEGDGTAEFNNVVVRGDIVGNWDGTDPANLATVHDSGATEGFYLDSSAGAAQFQGTVYLGDAQFPTGAANEDSPPQIQGAPTGSGALVIEGAIDGTVFPKLSLLTAPAASEIQLQADATTFLDADANEVARFNDEGISTAARGVLGYTAITSNHGHNTTEADCTGVTSTVTAGTGRRLRITVKTIVEQVTGAGNATLKIHKDGGEIQRATDTKQTGEFDTITLVAYDTPTAGSHTYKSRGVASANGFNCVAAAGFPMFILVEDIGPA